VEQTFAVVRDLQLIRLAPVACLAHRGTSWWRLLCGRRHYSWICFDAHHLLATALTLL